MDNTPNCPKCDSDSNVREIVYGLFDNGWNKNNPDLIAGGCTYDKNSPNFICDECLHAWQDETIFKKDYLHHESSDILNEIERVERESGEAIDVVAVDVLAFVVDAGLIGLG
mgnify:CR=1 FL=1